MKNNWVLIGYMGCGKTTAGRYLAGKLQLPFLDTDEWIEKKEGCSVSCIFSQKGEEAFRRMETDCLRELIAGEEKGVFSVGGGLPIREENRRLLKQIGNVVYLRTAPETIFARLEGDASRPLLQTEDRMERICEMLKIREPFYEAAAWLTVDTDGKTPEEIVYEILEMREKNEDIGNQRTES